MQDKKAALIFAIIALVVALFLAMHRISLLSNSEVASGVVIANISARHNSRHRRNIQIGGSSSKAPYVEFKTAENKLVRFKSDVSISFFRYKVGEKVKVVYNPYNPKEAEIKKFFPMWFPTLFMLLFSGILFAIRSFRIIPKYLYQ